MSDTDLVLGRVLGLCFFGLNERARRAVEALLPVTLADDLQQAWRTPDALLDGATQPIERRLAAPWIARRDASDIETGDDAADEPPPGEATGEEPDDVEAFFAAGDGDSDERADDSGEEEGGAPSSRLPAALMARLLAGRPPTGPAEPAAARLLADLPLAMQGDVVVMIARSTVLSVRRDLSGDEQPALDALRDVLGGEEVWGVGRAVGILRALDGTAPLRRALTAALEVDGEVVNVLQSHLFDFDDLVRLRDTELQALLGACDNRTLAQALIESGEAVRDRIVANVSDRRARLLEDELVLHAASTPDEIDLARRQILARARQLYESGTITTYFGSLPSADPDESLIVEEEDETGTMGDPEEAEGEAPVAPRRELNLRRVAIAGLVAGALFSALAWFASALGRPKPSPSSGASVVSDASGRVVLGFEGAAATALEGFAQTAAGPLRPAEGETLETEEDEVDALIEIPMPDGISTIEAAAGSHVQRLRDRRSSTDPGGQDVARVYLRVGRLKVSVAATGFVVRTPAARVTGTRGSVFRVRVVLDGTTWVEGVSSTTIVGGRGGRPHRLGPGQGVRVDVDGDTGSYRPAED